MALLGVDIGTTNCKAGVFDEDGRELQLAARKTPWQRDAEGLDFCDPKALWHTVLSTIQAALAGAGNPRIAGIGVTSMAESGLLVATKTGLPLSPILPWFDAHAENEAERIASSEEAVKRFSRFGIYASYKCSLAKILWQRQRNPECVPPDGCWLCAADLIVHNLTGCYATDYSLAGRTHAYNLSERRWDEEWLSRFNLPSSIFPPVFPATKPAGGVRTDEWKSVGISRGTPVMIAGHDHVCAASGAGLTQPGEAFDSMGTAEVLTGAMQEQCLGENEHRSGLTFGLLPDGGTMYWLGGLSAAGGSLEWLQRILGEPPLTHRQLDAMLAQTTQRPRSLIYLPYLSGSGAPHPSPAARAAFIGMNKETSRADLLRAVLEGTAFQMESIHQAAAALINRPISPIVAGGGGAQNTAWLRVKANVYGVPVVLAACRETACCGAARYAGIGCGAYADLQEAVTAATGRRQVIEPDAREHAAYRAVFEQHFSKWQKRLTSVEESYA